MPNICDEPVRHGSLLTHSRNSVRKTFDHLEVLRSREAGTISFVMAEQQLIYEGSSSVRSRASGQDGRELNEESLKNKIRHVFDYSDRHAVDLVKFRAALLKDGPTDSSILQIVGDSGTSFDEASLGRAKRILADAITETTFIEYGWTYQPRDANWLIVDYLQIHPEIGQRVIVNAVDASFDAVQTGQWFVSSLARQSVVVKGSPPTQFGDDTWISDGVMQPGDRMLCFEGGVQALRQCINMLLARIDVTAVTDLRSASKFSAARLLSQLKQEGRPSQHENTKVQEQIDRLFMGGADLELVTIA